jgi:hypothetical protein
MLMVLAVGLSGLAAAAVGVAHQLLPRRFTVAQQRQIMTWEMTRRWRALPAGQMFPAVVAYHLATEAVQAGRGPALHAHRLGIGRQASCGSVVSAAAVPVLTARHCTVLLRATYLDSSGSMIVTVGIAVLPDSSSAAAVASALSAARHGPAFALRALAVAGTSAAGFRDGQRQLSWAAAAGTYVVMSTAGLTDGRRRVPLGTDPYYYQEMTSLTVGLTEATGTLIGVPPAVPVCPGAPGC